MKRKKNGEMTFIQKVVKYRILLLMCLPAIVFFFLFNYVPLPGIYVAFVKYNYRDGSSERKTSHSAEQMFCSQISIFILGFRGSYPQSMAANSPSSLLLWITFLDFLLSPCQAPPPLL